MSLDKYRYNPARIRQIITQQTDLLERVREAHQEAQNILNQVENYDNWQGQQRTEFESFFQLIVKYHEDVASNGTLTPYEQFVAAFVELEQNMLNFTENSPSFQELNSL